MRLYVIFMILLQNYEKTVHAYNYRFFWRRDCVLIILFQLYGSNTGVFEGNLFWVGHYDRLCNLHIGRRTNPILI